MSHQTGIKGKGCLILKLLVEIIILIIANEELKKFLGKCRDGKVRAIKVSILEGMCFYFNLRLL